MNEVTAKLVSTAWELARIQIEGIKDFVGFNNSDKNVGAHLAAVVEADPTDEDAVRRLAALVGVKYQRQTATIVGQRMLEDFKTLAKGTKLTQEDRDAARMTMVAQPDVHPRFGARILFSFQFNPTLAGILKDNGGRAFMGPDGWKWAIQASRLTVTVSELKAAGARIVGSLDVSDIAPEELVTGRAISARLDGKGVYLKFKYDPAIVSAIKELPGRRYDAQTREWRIDSKDLALAAEHLGRIAPDVDVTALLALADLVPQVARPVGVVEAPVAFEAHLPATVKDFQTEGIAWLTRPLDEARKSCVGGASIRGYILGDKPGLGKTLVSEVAAKAILDTLKPDGRVVVITPANHKVGWAREITRFCGAEQTINVCNGDNGPDITCRWNVINYDILAQWYEALIAMGFDILIIDEAHYAKNYDSIRSKLIVGGKVPSKKPISEAQKKTIREQFAADAKMKGVPVDQAKLNKALNAKEVIKIDGLAAAATMRVFPLTGTPLDNRPKDLFNLLRAIGHPLGRNFQQFAVRYCNPTYTQVGKRVYAEYNGQSNLAELRERLAPVFLQRHDAGLKGKLYREWNAAEIDVTEYKRVMDEYAARREAGELKTSNDHLSFISEARRCAASAMVPVTIERIENALEADEKVIVFSYYTDCIKRFKAHFGDAAVVIDGSVSNNVNKTTGQSKRQTAMDTFQNDPNVKVLVGQLTAAGVAVTLTAATQVKFNDLGWKPGEHFQCEKRAHRIGQTKDVFVEYMVAAGTFYEEMATMLEEKLEDMNAFEGTDESLFLDLVAVLNTTAPKNEEAKRLMLAREKGTVKRPHGA